MIKEFKTAVVILDQLFPFLDNVYAVCIASYLCLIIIGSTYYGTELSLRRLGNSQGN